MLISNAELNGKLVVDVRCGQGRIIEIGTSLCPQGDESVIDAAGGALLPGLHDHHIHLFSLAAAQASVQCGPPRVTGIDELTRILQKSCSNSSGWIRGIGYHESVAGLLDRWQLDKIVSDRPLRIQHRSGKMWLLNSVAAELLGLQRQHGLHGIECDASGVATGRLLRLDSWLRTRLDQQDWPDLAAVSARLASFGVTGVTDATAANSTAVVREFTNSIKEGKLLQRVLIMGDARLPEPDHGLLRRGALKILLDEHQLPEFDRLTNDIKSAHRQQRPVAIHCVTRTELIFALSALMGAGNHPGDRIEHASITPDEAIPLMLAAGITVVTQPGFIRERGDQYLFDVEPRYHDSLYRCRSLLLTGIPLGGSTDAPYTEPDPWQAMRAAVERRSEAGHALGEREKLTPEQALALFTSPADAPGAVSGPLEVGAPADLCLLDRHWAEARCRLHSNDVCATFRGGELIYRRSDARDRKREPS